MIKSPIKETALTTQRSNEYFAGKIEAASMNQDVSMAATCRVLFGPRLKDKEKINVTIKSNIVRDDFTVSGLVDEIKGIHSGDLMVYSYMNPSGSTTDWKSIVAEAMKSTNMYLLEDITKWFASNNINALVYTDKPHDDKIPKSPMDNTCAVIFIESLNQSRWHTIQTLLKRLMGKWFMEKPLTPEETNGIILAINAGDEATYLETVAAYANTLDFRSGFIRKQLDGFEKRFEKERIKQLEHDVKRIDDTIENYTRKIGEELLKREDIVHMLYGYQMNGGDTEPFVMNYFLANKNLFLKSCNADYLEFYTMGWFDGWDPDAAKNTFAKNHMTSWLQYNSNYGINNADAKLLYKAIFLDETVRLRLWSHFVLALRGGDVVRIGNDQKPEDITNALPNPHHFYNHCLGNNTKLIADAMRTREIVSAIEQCISATKGVNLHEQVSYKFLARDLFNPDFGKVIYIKAEDKFMTTKEAIEYLKKEGK